MIKRYLSFALCCLLLVAANSALISAQTKTVAADSTAKIKADVQKRGTGEKKRVKVKMLNGTKLSGYLSRAGEDSFDVTDPKTRQTTSVSYADVAQVTGSGLSKGAKIGLGVGLGAAAVVAIVVIRFFSIYCNNEGC